MQLFFAGKLKIDGQPDARDEASDALQPPVTAPLEGVRVLDLTRLLPGPFASLVLADLGASVDKVEDVGAGDYLRLTPPLVGDTSGLFLALNRDKRSACLDLKKDRGALGFAPDRRALRRAVRAVPARRDGPGSGSASACCSRATRASSSARCRATGRTGRWRRARGTTSTTWHARASSECRDRRAPRRRCPGSSWPTSAGASGASSASSSALHERDPHGQGARRGRVAARVVHGVRVREHRPALRRRRSTAGRGSARRWARPVRHLRDEATASTSRWAPSSRSSGSPSAPARGSRPTSPR